MSAIDNREDARSTIVAIIALVKVWTKPVRVASVLLAILAFASACQSQPPDQAQRVEVGAIATREGPLPVDAKTMRSAVDRELQRTRYLRSNPAASEVLTVDLWLADASGEAISAATTEFLLAAEVDVPQALREVLGESRVTAKVLLEGAGQSGDLQQDLSLAARRAIEVLDTQIGLARGDRRVLEMSLKSADPEQICLALEWIRDHRPNVSADVVADLLRHRDLRVVRLAVEALRNVGNRSHVPEIVRAVDLRDPDYTREVYRTLAALGGPDAARFLEFAAANEDNPSLRNEAKRAFEFVLARAPATGGDIFDQTDDTAGDRVGGATGSVQPIRGHR